MDLGEHEHLGEAFSKINPDCTVPVLELDNGTRITEVFAICQYLEQEFPDPPLMGRNSVERALVTMWNSKIEHQGLAAIADGFRNHARGLKGRALTGPDNYEQIPELVERGRRRITIFMGKMDGQLNHGDYVVGDAFTVADISLLVTVEFAARIKVSIADDMHNLRRWYEQVSARPAAQV